MTQIDTSNEIEWPREIWMAERVEHDQGVVSAVLSEWATVARFEGDTERDRDFHKFIDADIHESAERYWKMKLEEIQAERDTLSKQVEDTARECAELVAENKRLREDGAAPVAIKDLTFAAQHNPNCPSPWLVRLTGKSTIIDMKPRAGFGLSPNDLTSDILGYGKTFAEAARAALEASK